MFYRNGDKMMAVEIEPGASFRARPPKVLFEGRYSMIFGSYDVSADGKRFLMIRSAGQEGVLNRFGGSPVLVTAPCGRGSVTACNQRRPFLSRDRWERISAAEQAKSPKRLSTRQEEGGSGQVHIVLEWFEEIRRRARVAEPRP